MKRFKIIDVVGARPQFIKLAAFASAIRSQDVDYVIINTDQHYDSAMNDNFFSEYNIPKPKYSLGIGSGTHAEQTAKMLTALETVIVSEKPDLVQVYGDTNSTLAGALVASKLKVPLCHLEAGMRSFNRDMPEELNRIVTDHLSNLLFVPTKTALTLLRREGITKNCHWIGDVMLDVVMHWKKNRVNKPAPIEGNYAFATIHRAENTDNQTRLENIIEGFKKSSAQILLCVHPRLQKFISQYGITLPENVKVISPLSHSDTLNAIMHSNAVITDSGGLQKEAFYLGRPCVTVREQTEWTELVKNKVNVITGTNTNKISKEIIKAMKKKQIHCPKLFNYYGSGTAGKRAVKIIQAFLNKM